jgi:hypothetical protein
MIPKQILAKIDRPSLKAKLRKRLKHYIDANSVDKVILAGHRMVENYLMEVVVPFFDVEDKELAEWWCSGWTGKEHGHILPPHKDFMTYAVEIITEIYQEKQNG